MPTATARKPRAPKVLDALMTAEEFFRALMQTDTRYLQMESGIAGDSEQVFLMEQQGALVTLTRDARPFADYMAARRLSEEPKVSPIMREHPTPTAKALRVRTLWCRIPITLLPLQMGKLVQHQYKRIDTASESTAWATLRQAEVAPQIVLHEGDALVGIWRISPDQSIPDPEHAEVWLQQLSRALPGAQMSSAKDLLHIPSDAARLCIVPRAEVFARWLGERDGTVSLGELTRWLFSDGVIPDRARPIEATWREKFLSGVKPY